ncbi:hypothetical protein [Halorubrum sp. CSM-61]|uniref:hypothetical protein n=1 Tax=Halorubrum sp. CSM-61 TaxID=2485838 RepID=UPI000F4D29A1|nr:hypothetical protein [Halorubrum sp. CSM-61]
MVSKDKIEADGLTTEDVLDVETAQPQTEVRILPEWEEHPEERPGENLRIEENTLLYDRDGFEVAIESYETTHWRVELSIPKEVGKWYPRPLDLKCLSVPEYGFVESVETSDSYETIGATLIIQENFQPTFEVREVIEHLLENAEASEEFTEELDEKLEAARENERELKEQKIPGWDGEAFTCPHCKEDATHAAVDDDPDDPDVKCIHCGESIAEWVDLPTE